MIMQLQTKYMKELLVRCIEEDGGLCGDVTSNAAISPDETGSYALHVREQGTLAGIVPLADSISVFDSLTIDVLRKDGEEVNDERIAVVSGKVRSILLAERTMLNILGHASGIATRTREFVKKVADTNCKICDTRKTTPGLRLLDKYAVFCGGGTSHRMGLHDAALFKDNHVVALHALKADLRDAIAKARTNPELQFVEVEVDTLEQFEQVMLLDVDIVLLDNMTNRQLEEAVAMRDVSNTSLLLEASGGVNLETVSGVANTGVDRISIGGLTHHAHWLDIGLDAIDE